MNLHDRVTQIIFVAGTPRKKRIFGTVTKDNLTDMVGGPEVEVLWDGDTEPCGENPNELDLVTKGANQ